MRVGQIDRTYAGQATVRAEVIVARCRMGDKADWHAVLGIWNPTARHRLALLSG